MSPPPSQAVIEAVEQAESRHTYLMFGECSCGYLSLEYKGWRSHRHGEVARAADAAAEQIRAALSDTDTDADTDADTTDTQPTDQEEQ